VCSVIRVWKLGRKKKPFNLNKKVAKNEKEKRKEKM
jgi:hypothetical protein